MLGRLVFGLGLIFTPAVVVIWNAHGFSYATYIASGTMLVTLVAFGLLALVSR